jgi:hypothetical protein
MLQPAAISFTNTGDTSTPTGEPDTAVYLDCNATTPLEPTVAALEKNRGEPIG